MFKPIDWTLQHTTSGDTKVPETGYISINSSYWYVSGGYAPAIDPTKDNAVHAVTDSASHFFFGFDTSYQPYIDGTQTNTIKFGWHRGNADNALWIYEDGLRVFSTVAENNGKWFGVEIGADETVVYRLNGAIVYTSSQTASGTLLPVFYAGYYSSHDIHYDTLPQADPSFLSRAVQIESAAGGGGGGVIIPTAGQLFPRGLG